MSVNHHIAGSDQPKPEELPDSRRSHHRPTVCGPAGIMAQVYCANCGKDGGLVTEEWAEHIFYLCDPCAEKYGQEPPGTVQIPEEVVQGKKSDPLWNSILEQSK